jgi:hypothetical protein
MGLEIPFITADSGGFTHYSRDSSYIAIELEDHFFDSEDRAEWKHAKRKNATITKFGAPCKGIKPIRPSVQRKKPITA